MKTSYTLKQKLEKFCISERNKRKHLTYNYGTVCVGVEDSHQNCHECACSHSQPVIYSLQLANRLKSLGIIGKSKKNHCLLGYCAEPHAANNLLKKLNRIRPKASIVNTSSFIFTKALRVRTHQEVAYCDFCKHTFPQL